MRIRTDIPLLVAAVCCLAWPSAALASSAKEEELRTEGMTVEVDHLEVERDEDFNTVELQWEIDAADFSEARRRGLAIWLQVDLFNGSFAGEVPGEEWSTWRAIAVSDHDGSVQLPDDLTNSDKHVGVRVLAVSDGRHLPPLHALYGQTRLTVGVDPLHDDDHKHVDDRAHAQHNEVNHGRSVYESTEVQLKHIGSLFRYDWFAPRYGYANLCQVFALQSLAHQRLHLYLSRHHHSRFHSHGTRNEHRRRR